MKEGNFFPPILVSLLSSAAASPFQRVAPAPITTAASNSTLQTSYRPLHSFPTLDTLDEARDLDVGRKKNEAKTSQKLFSLSSSSFSFSFLRPSREEKEKTKIGKLKQTWKVLKKKESETEERERKKR